MNITILGRILRLFGFTGKTLDKAIAQMNKLDSYLEQVEAIEKANAAKADEAVRKAAEASKTASANAERASRIRARAQEFVA